MKIAVHLPRIDPSIGGGFTFADGVLRGLLVCAADTPHELVIYTESATAECPPHPRLSYEPVSTDLLSRIQTRLCAGLNALQDAWLRRRRYPFRAPFERSLRARGIDVVWFATPTFVECNLPYVYTVWDLQHVLQPWFPEVSRDGLWENRQRIFSQAILRASAVVVPNTAGAADLQRAFPIDSGRVLKLAQPTPAFALAPSPKNAEPIRKFQIKPPFLFYPAQFWPHKDHVTALETLKLLRDAGRDFSLVFTGSDQSNAAFVQERAVALGIAAHVHFLGFVSIEQMRALYEEAFALLYVSHFGPENLPPLEAFGLGCPAVVSRFEGAHEQLGDAALLVEPMNPVACAAAITRLQEEPALRESFIARGRARAAQWREEDYVRAILRHLDGFDRIRQRWSAS